jgi:adenosylhomocysteine nucleosidase
MQKEATMTEWRVRALTGGLVIVALVLAGWALPAVAHDRQDDVRRIAVVSAFAPEMSVLRGELDNATVHSINGVEFVAGTLEGQNVVLFLSGISVVNAAMTVQLALDHFTIDRIVFSGIAGGVDPALHIGDVVIADRWGQYLEVLFAREVESGWAKPPFFDYPFANFGMMFPRSVMVQRASAEAPDALLVSGG